MRDSIRAKRVVVKVGSSTLTDSAGRLNEEQVVRLAMEVADLVRAGSQVVLVTSGAVATGSGRLGRRVPQEMAAKQALAAIGQGLLVDCYHRALAPYGIPVGQVLLTREDLEDEHRRRNCHSTVDRLLKWGALPVVNENDTVAYEEIKVGDNDTLSARVAALIGADLLVILSDVDGFYSRDPRVHPDARLLSTVREITSELSGSAGGAGTSRGTGGMATKVQAARIAGAAGIPTVVAHGRRTGVLGAVIRGEEVGTLFLPPSRVDGVFPLDRAGG